jgi:hypothetical protein
MWEWLWSSERKPLGRKGREGRLGLLPSGEKDEVKGGSSMVGDTASRGEMEKAELVSEMSEGAPSTDSALDTSETAGEGRGPSKCRRE